MNTAEVLVSLIARASPRLATMYFDHIEEYSDLLPHVFMGDVTRELLRLTAASSTVSENGDEVIKTVLRTLEHALEFEDPGARELIGASFLENIEDDDDAGDALKRLFGPRLRRAF